ncbi:glycosyltransferase family 90 protein [Polychaeton citri CBS 116435]|uniref:Glycosyltransferase family 90 protein n=1 Tax=Polychaeton citri CBS 116435 TaxID=1314669 RepID=A0A9P4UKR0_9PEZI|nr:glycosyltransferase family 90 protein [Polychaeton citri CBS 116435]
MCATSAFLLLDETEMLSGSGRALKISKLFRLISAISFAVLIIYYLRQPYAQSQYSPYPTDHHGDDFEFDRTPEPLAPLRITNNKVHPVDQLAQRAQTEWAKTLQGQSQTLEAAVLEYRKRYGMHPPPNFNKWYEFARAKGVKLVDEYDSIYDSLLPFWALTPATIRARTREALGFGGNNLIGLLLRDGKAVHVAGGAEWQQQATIGMMEQFLQYLPDMDLAFNIHDEPRVVVPHDELERLVKIALNEQIPKAFKQASPKNTWSARPIDLGKGKRIEEVKTTRFNVFAHQPTWIPSRLSCPVDSPARAVNWVVAQDNLTAYALGDLGFVYNHTAFSDICNSPSLATSHGFFDRPNAFNVVHDLVPIFSQSKMSSFQDILYPSPWYWYGKVNYDAKKDMDWTAKGSRLWWRGSTTGGFSRDGGWRRQHRQQFVRKVNALDQAKIMKNIHSDDANAQAEWAAEEIPRQDMKDIMDVHFSHIGQCDPGDCDAQREFFNVVEPADQQEAWRYKYLLDIDGNAFSGRFYAFLKSNSLTFKMAVFREWHEEWIKPWVHYVPLSLRADETLEAVRYFSAEEEGQKQAIGMAKASQAWAKTALRNEDFEVWFFRLLLEYGRLIDDDRDSIGYTGS